MKQLGGIPQTFTMIIFSGKILCRLKKKKKEKFQTGQR
jgi:hypothetical protein